LRESTNKFYSPLANEKGIALVTALMITLLLTLVVIALSHRVGLFTMGTRDHVIKSQNLYTAEIGLNQARYFLMAGDCIPPNFSSCPGLESINKSTFTNMSGAVKRVFTGAMPEFTVAGEKYNFNLTGNMTHGTGDSYDYKIYIKETNIPKVVNILAVSGQPGSELVKTVIDAGLIYTAPLGSGYKQAGQGGTREGISGESLGADGANARETF